MLGAAPETVTTELNRAFRVRLLRPVHQWCIAVAFFLSAVTTGAAEQRYTVKYGETLSQIARRFSVSIEALSRRNWLNSPNLIRSGQILIIPDKQAAEIEPQLDPAFLERLNRIKPIPRKWHYVVIHHSAMEMGNPVDMDRYHREHSHMTNGLAYHFVIGNGNGMVDGEVAIGLRWSEQLDGGHLRSDALNAESIGICLVGNFDNDPPTEKQLAALHALILDLLHRCGLTPSAVKTHQQINPVFTRCPGKQFPAKAFLDAVKRSFDKIRLLNLTGLAQDWKIPEGALTAVLLASAGLVGPRNS